MLCKRASHNIWRVFTQQLLCGLESDVVPNSLNICTAIHTTFVVRNWIWNNICCVKMLFQVNWNNILNNISINYRKCRVNTWCWSKMLIKRTRTTFRSTFCAKKLSEMLCKAFWNNILDQQMLFHLLIQNGTTWCCSLSKSTQNRQKLLVSRRY